MSANTTTAFTTKLRKIDGPGYRVWARQLQLYLEVKDVWSAQERPLHQLEMQQKLAMTIILAALTDDQAALVADLQHPKAMLGALQKTHRHVCDTTTRLMLAELECYKVVLTDAEKKSNFLQSLGPDWNGYIAVRGEGQVLQRRE
ncbi:uncharacterized protein PITG_21931 [Phytophthora infestans T30-4]|uniref:DUF4219 domain-containing protein n=1 Tax=Phytophthora infestans (strain T30-4) TaxID=403677 RepID=D0P4P4_PHYIT|nr:uncharacterized protein PITG_21931 [Phytophthora infestans T30-4]EEY68669.1 hypothetical protein PITG_21931 [Phytophthora infestans T30-4]|eukprot:XP_002996905.1 hypothetical protein PITG_21931 [Phytophthora infestans T30-4]